nr:nuclear RNA export factor 1-like [Leptinotarsa decemlineata]
MPRQHGNRQDTWVQKDDRYSRADRDRRVTFKQNNRHGGKNKGRDWSGALREHLQDEDIDMGFSAGSSKTNRYNNGGRKGRKGSPMPTGNVKRKLLEGPTNWYRVSLPHGDKYEKNFLLKLFVDKLAPLPFWPIAWQVYGSTVMFYVDDFKVAEKLFNLSRTVQMPNGFNLIIRVHPGCPNVDMTPSVKEKMKLVMAKRYNDVTKALDLKHRCNFVLNSEFTIILNICLDIIYVLCECSQDERFITRWPPWPAPFSVYSEVRKRFPKCLKLDGQDLPPPISFDIVEEHHLPAPCPMYLCHEDGNVIVRQFLQQYFQIYDSDNRQPLLQAYHEHASFSFTMGYPYGYGKEKNVPWLNWYQTDNRNLLRVQDSDRRFKLLKQGQLAVVSFLQDMPNTKHDMHSFTADLTLFTPLMLCLTVTGMFKELKGSQKNPPLRYFFRTLVIVPAGTGFCISNEVLYVTNATPDQSVEAFKTPINVITPPQPAPAASISSPGPSVPVIVPSIPDDAMKQEMVKQMSLQSGMNLEWSLKCLEETQWDYQKASLVFQKLNSEGIVPPEAFVK